MKKYIGFASLAIDGGKVGNDSILNCIIINPLKTLKPLLFDGVYHFTGDSESYKNIVSRIIEELGNIGIIITGIVTDNLRAQVIALDHRDERSIQRNSDIRALKTVLRIPCQCHVVSLAFNDLKSTIFLDGVERTLQIVIKSFRSKKFKKWIGAICPKICPTRWTNIFDILNFFLKHFKRLACIINTQNPIVREEVDSMRKDICTVLFHILPNLYGFMFLYNKLIHILESDSTLAAECPMIYTAFFKVVNEFMNQINNEHIITIGTLFCNSIKERLIRTGNINLLCFLCTFNI